MPCGQVVEGGGYEPELAFEVCVFGLEELEIGGGGVRGLRVVLVRTWGDGCCVLMMGERGIVRRRSNRG